MGSALADALPDGSTATDHLRVAVPLLAAHDPFRHDLRAEIIPAVGRRLLATLVSLLPRVGRRPATDSRFARKVWSLVSGERPDDNDLALVDQVLILLADHELAASTAAVRLAASFRADPYAATMAGLAVLSGAYHGAAGVEVERLFAEVEAEGATKAIGSRLSRTERLPGLGQVLYPEGDPRATALFDAARRHRPGHPTLDAVDEIVSISAQRGLPAPNVDFGTAALARVLGWKAGSTELLFSLARMAGWLAHAGEEYQHRSDIRLRAVYTGPLPDGA
jgi:citrate synthase